MSERPLFVGIDLGTTNSAVAVFDGHSVQLVRNAQGGNLTPSVVRIDGKGNVSVGAKARRLLESDPQNTRAEFKRLMGTGTTLDFAAAKAKKKPEELGAEVLRSLLADVREQLGVAPRCAVISVPALFEIPQSAATSEAARLAGLERVELIQEPIASAIAAGWRADDAAGQWLVYDLGGGTFDASLLETSEGFLRVVGHEGDNFLGGRDIDGAIVDWAIARLNEQGARLRRSDPEQAGAIRKLRLAAEEAKIELGRAQEASLLLPGLLDGLDVDLTLDRATLDALAAPLVDRSLAVCRRLLERHGVQDGALRRIVLVGGPTAMPALRRRVAEELGAPVSEGLDPMTLVAQGAALFAATAGLDGRPQRVDDAPAQKLLLHYPPLSSDLCPHVIGRLIEALPGGPLARVRLVRDDGWRSEEASVDEDGTFLLSAELVPRSASVFTLEGKARDGSHVPLHPRSITIVQGLTVTDPPLSRSIGVALASNSVHVYFERGTPLPARRTFVHATVEGVARGSDACILKIPMVQGEMPQAHLCRLVGALEIRGTALQASLPVGASVEVTLEVDRGGKLSARALIPSLQQTFEGVAHLMVPEASPETLAASHGSCAARLTSFRADAFRQNDARMLKKIHRADRELEQIAREVDAALGGDADAAQKARRALLDVEAVIEELELDRGWPELEDRARRTVASTSHWVSMYGSEIEQRYLKEAIEGVEKARSRRDPADLLRQLRVVRDLQDAAYYRDPEAWPREFAYLSSRLDSATDLPRARSLAEEGQRALEKKDTPALRGVVEKLWKLMPVDAQERNKGHESGVL
ncbi:MAG: Hsp70 family protein [Polyangiaceae bacterium]|jgi:molecular chaperone DnaK|nr:Hsp70 family protein [Polyangiaceae bacterium]